MVWISRTETRDEQPRGSTTEPIRTATRQALGLGQGRVNREIRKIRGNGFGMSHFLPFRVFSVFRGGQPLWSARTCPRFRQATCRRRMGEGVQRSRAVVRGPALATGRQSGKSGDKSPHSKSLSERGSVGRSSSAGHSACGDSTPFWNWGHAAARRAALLWLRPAALCSFEPFPSLRQPRSVFHAIVPGRARGRRIDCGRQGAGPLDGQHGNP